MDRILEYLKRPLVIGILAFVAGLLIGWMVIGWLVDPVQWTNASPVELHPGYQDIWLTMAIQAYGATGNDQAAVTDYQYLGDSGPSTLARLASNPPANLQHSVIAQFSQVVGANLPSLPTTQPGTTPTATPGGTGRGNLTTLLVVMCLVLLVVGGAIAVFFFMQNRRRGGGITTAPQTAGEEPISTVEWTNLPPTAATSTGQAPMAQFMASYKAGDDLFDDSFSIDSPSGEFLGECGVGISETIGVGVPKKVTAFEVWLFDKNDIQTVTKVLMSAHAFNDPTIRQKLEAKGEPFQAASGGQTILETATLKLVARVVDMAYGQGALPDNSFFDSLVLELAIWQKQ